MSQMLTLFVLVRLTRLQLVVLYQPVGFIASRLTNGVWVSGYDGHVYTVHLLRL